MKPCARSLAAAVLTTVAILSGCASYGKLARYQDRYQDREDFFQSRGVPSFRAGAPALYMDGPAWSERALELIAGAEDYILIMSFLVTAIPRQEEIYDALAARMAEGIEVYIITDSASYFRTYPRVPEPVPAAVSLARERGIPIIEYNPIRGSRIFTFLGLFDRDHRKFWVVDGRVVAAGGQNIDYDSLRAPSDAGCVDAMMEFESGGAAAFLRDSFIETWNAYSLDRLDADDFTVHDGAQDFSLAIFDQGLRDTGNVTDLFDGFFTFARKELWLVQCYTYLTPSLLDKIRFAIDRGVKVHVVLSDNHVTIRSLQGSLYGIKDLLDAGVSVHLYESPTGSLLHYKMMMADGSWAAVGSTNFNLRSQTTSRELSFLVSDPESMAIIRAGLDGILTYCRPVRREEALTYRGLPYFVQNLLMQFWG
jgi:cardiolipin synthase